MRIDLQPRFHSLVPCLLALSLSLAGCGAAVNPQATASPAPAAPTRLAGTVSTGVRIGVTLRDGPDSTQSEAPTPLSEATDASSSTAPAIGDATGEAVGGAAAEESGDIAAAVLAATL